MLYFLLVIKEVLLDVRKIIRLVIFLGCLNCLRGIWFCMAVVKLLSCLFGIFVLLKIGVVIGLGFMVLIWI